MTSDEAHLLERALGSILDWALMLGLCIQPIFRPWSIEITKYLYLYLYMCIYIYDHICIFGIIMYDQVIVVNQGYQRIHEPFTIWPSHILRREAVVQALKDLQICLSAKPFLSMVCLIHLCIYICKTYDIPIYDIIWYNIMELYSIWYKKI